MLLAAEELLLFLLDEQNATLLPMTVRTEHLVLAGAVLMDLQLANRIDTDLDNLTVSNPTPLGDDVLDPTLADIVGAEKTHDALYWVERTARRGHEIRERTIARLVSRGILLAPGDEGFLSLTPEVAHARRYPSTNGAVQEDVKLRIMRVLFSEDIPAPADIVVVSLVNACDVWRKLLTAEELVKARKRIEIVSRLDLVGRAVATLVGIVRPTAPAARGAAAGLPLARGLPLVGSTFAVWRDPRKFFVTHDLPEHFPHPERFDIDRYLPGREEHKQPGVFTPFGVGVHHCAGRGFAETQLPLIVATLLHEAEMELVPATYELKTERWMRSGRQPRAAPGARRGIPVGARVRLRTAGRPWSPQPRRCASISSTSHPGPPPTSPRAAPARGPCLEGIADSSRLHPLIGARRERHDAVRRRPDSPRPAKATGRARGLQPVGNRRHRHAAVEVGRTTVTGLGADGASAPSGRTGRSDAGHRQFGNLTRIQEQSHYVFAFRHVEDLLKDLRYGVRMVLKHPGFSATAIIVLALGIGANSAIFNVINAMLLKPLPIHRPGELVGVYVERTTAPGGYRPFSYPNFQDLREQAAAFANLAAHNVTLVGIGDGEATRRVWADAVTANYFETFGVPLALGRAFTAAEEHPEPTSPWR